jgi:putative flippase GtrA
MISMSTPGGAARELLGYGLVSCVALGVDMCVLHGLVDGFGWHYLPAGAVAFLAGAALSYLLSVRFVFSTRKLHNPYLECIAFITLVGLAVNAGAMFIAIGTVGLGLTAGKLFAAGCTFAANFTLRRRLLFTTARSA